MDAKVRARLFALFNARAMVKQDLCAQGITLSHVDPNEVTASAQRYLAAHPELLAEAEETVRNFPKLRTLAQWQAQQHRRIPP